MFCGGWGGGCEGMVGRVEFIVSNSVPSVLNKLLL